MFWLVLGALAVAALNDSGGSSSTTLSMRKRRNDVDEEFGARGAKLAAQHALSRQRLREQQLTAWGTSWWYRRRILKREAIQLASNRVRWEKFFALQQDPRILLKYDDYDLARRTAPPPYVVERRLTIEEQLTLENRARVSQRIERMVAERRASISPARQRPTQELIAIEEWAQHQRAAHARFDVFLREAMAAAAMQAALVRHLSRADVLMLTHSQLEQHREAWVAYLASPAGRQFNTRLGQLGETPDWPIKPPAPTSRSRRPTAALSPASLEVPASDPAPEPVRDGFDAPGLPESWQPIFEAFQDGVVGHARFRQLGERCIAEQLAALEQELPPDDPDRDRVLGDMRSRMAEHLEDLSNAFLKARSNGSHRNAGGVT